MFHGVYPCVLLLREDGETAGDVDCYVGESLRAARMRADEHRVWIIVGAILQCTAFSVPHLMVARFITGIGTGIETSTVPMYQSELCEASKRGRLVSSEPLFVGVGIEIAVSFNVLDMRTCTDL